MSEVFDPEKVTRWSPFPEGTVPKADGVGELDWPEEYVSVADYDKLLALYREAVKPSNGGQCSATSKCFGGDLVRCQLPESHNGSHHWTGLSGSASWVRDSQTHPAIIP